MSEIVYVLTNPAMPDYIKIGKTTQANLKSRLNTLNNRTAVPEKFILEKAVVVEDATKIERLFHDAFASFRPTRSREFFKIEPEPVITLLEAFGTDVSETVQKVFDENITPEEKETQQAFVAERVEKNERRSHLRFSDIGILPGAELAFKFDSAKKCRVVDERKVEYAEETFTLSALAMKLLREDGRHYSTMVQGALYFTYGGVETLADRRDRIETERERDKEN